MIDYGKELAKAALDIGAISLKPNDPFQWASGYRMPIYNDNRKHLRYPENRNLITEGFKKIIRDNYIKVDMITGTSTSGIAPAASLAQELNVPIGIIEGGWVNVYTQERIKSYLNLVAQLIDSKKVDYDVIVSTCPGSIIPAIFAANNKNLPFAYVREKQKEHGLKQQIESTIKENDKVLLLDFYGNESYLERAKNAVKEKGGKVIKSLTLDIGDEREEPNLKGKNILHIEDLVSTGGSCIEEMKVWKGNSAIIDNALTIFSYDFPESLELFENNGIDLKSIFGYDKLLLTALEEGEINEQQHEMLKDWRSTPFEWGAKHGFPKVEKK